MKELSPDQIRRTAHQLAEAGFTWHFHILTPTCQFNTKPQYAFVFEDLKHLQFGVHYSSEIENELGRELAPLLHGNEVFDLHQADHSYRPAPTIQRMIERAQNLNDQQVEWHHHLLFPGCQYNPNASQYTLVFEDPETNTKLENTTDHEPTTDLKVIENLFYAQH